MILRTLTALAAPAGARSRLSVFYFHRALTQPDPLLPFEPDAKMFDRILGWIGSQFRVLDPLEACEHLYGGTLPARPAVISFDDGYRDNYTVALPVLQQHRMQAVFFIATGFLDGGMMFNDRVIEAVRQCATGTLKASMFAQSDPQGLPLRTFAERRVAIQRILAAVKHLPPAERLQRVSELESDIGAAPGAHMMMNREQLLALHRAGMRVGGHTRTHPILESVDDEEAREEINGGRAELQALLGLDIDLFAYPNGKFGRDFSERHAEMVKRAGYRFAFTTDPGTATHDTDSCRLPRFTPWDRTRLRFGARALRNLVGAS